MDQGGAQAIHTREHRSTTLLGVFLPSDGSNIGPGFVGHDIDHVMLRSAGITLFGASDSLHHFDHGLASVRRGQAGSFFLSICNAGVARGPTQSWPPEFSPW